MPPLDPAPTEPHVILCGLGRVGRRVLDYLRAANVPVVVIERKADVPAGVTALVGDFRSPELLKQAGIDRARGVIVCTSDDLVNVSTALTARGLNPAARVVVRVFTPALVERLGQSVRGIAALSVSALTAPVIALVARAGEALGAFTAADGPRQVCDLAVTAESPLCGRTLADAADRYQLLVLAHAPVGSPIRYLRGIDAAAPLAVGDRVVVCAEPKAVGRVTNSVESAQRVRWAGRLRRAWRVAVRTVTAIDPAVLAATAVLVVAVLGSTLVFHFALGESLATGVFHTVRVMATQADLSAEGLTGPMKVFVSVLRLAGAALTAVFTAIVTQYLLRAQFGAALEARRIPDAGHFVVCGLGNIGYRVVEELLASGHKVVVVESNRDNRFLASVRRTGAAVVPGDATLPEVLKQARAATARAVVVTSGQDLVNLETALLARELNPAQRVVVRLGDPDLARSLREAADVRLALSPPQLAAPAFVAALYGDRVRGVFLVGGKVLAAVELGVAAGEAGLDGETVRALMIDADVFPVSLEAAKGRIVDSLLDHRLGPGDRLTVIGELTAFDRMYRRERPPANWSVEVTGFPLTARPVLTTMFRALAGLSADAAAKALDALPARLKGGLTRGQADDLMEHLARERVSGRVVADGG